MIQTDYQESPSTPAGAVGDHPSRQSWAGDNEEAGGCEPVEDGCKTLNGDKSMAESVTRHASNPSVILKQYRYTGRESATPTNSLPDTLPEKDEQDQYVLRVVESGRASAQVQGNILIDKLIRKTIDQAKQEDYNLYHGKSDRIEGPRKEINNGSI